ncbi:MAG: PD-(D/E)XK nuclease family protein [Clostridia bacterium]|nr:PD-(D/E)XK nuclease family protein [Clostridia bacterium]
MAGIQILGMRTGRTLPHLIPQIAASRAAGRRVLLLVPEQYTLQAEQELIDGLQVPGLLDTEVLSPSRLRLRVRESAGSPPLPMLNERGRVMLFSRILLHEQKNLQCYGSSATQPGLADKVSAAIADLEDLGYDAAWLSDQAEIGATALTRAKLSDLAMLWARYDEAMAGRFLGSEAELTQTIQRLGDSGLVEGADVYVCGFDWLGVRFCDLLLAIQAHAASLTVAMTLCDDQDPDRRAFQAQIDSVRWLIRSAKKAGIEAALRFVPIEDPGKDPSLKYLERNLFVSLAAPQKDETHAIQIHTAANPYAEAEYAAARLLEWHRAGIPWDRMGIALSKTDRLPSILAMVMRQAHIPCYVIRKESAARHGLCRMVTAALRAAGSGFDQKQVLAVVDSGFSPLSDDEGVRLRAYAIENGIRWKKWLVPFTRGEEAAETEPLREKLMEPLIALREALRTAKDGAEAAEAIWKLLEDTSCYEKLQAREEFLLSNGMEAEASQNRQVWNTVLELLDQLHTLFAGQRIGTNDLARILDAGLSGVSLNSLPPTPDVVTVGETGHMLTGAMDALIVMGMQDGVTAANSDSLLTDEEMTALSGRERKPLSKETNTLTALRRSDFYRTLTLPDRFLTLTLSASGTDGGALRACSLIEDVKRLFPSVRHTGGAAADGLEDAPLSPEQAAERLPLLLRRQAETGEPVPDAWLDALRILWQGEELKPLALRVEKAIHGQVKADSLKAETVAAIFRQSDLSISRLETFASCPFRHFVQEGLAPKERREYAFQPDERGNFFHAVLARYAALASKIPGWPDITEEQFDDLVNRAIAPERETWADGPLTEDGIGGALADEAIRAVRRAAQAFTSHAKQSGFSCIGTEVRFGESGGLPPVVLRLSDGRHVALRGVIDRIDRWEGDKGVFLRVVDYKSSDRKLEAVRMFYGLQLQLILYLRAATAGLKGAPAGAYYFTVQDPLVESDSDIISEVETRLAEKLRLRGITLADAEVIRAMNGEDGPAIIAKALNKDGSIMKGSMAADAEGIDALMRYGQKTAETLAEQLYSGDIAISPAKVKDWTACEYCPYKGICGWDSRLPGAQYRELEKEDAWPLMTAQAQ